MKTHQKKKTNRHEEAENDPYVGTFRRSFSQLNRSLTQFSEGLRSRMMTVQEHVLVEPLESVAWTASQQVRKIQSRIFDFIDERVSRIEEARSKKLDHQTALERFDGEGGAMQATRREDQEESESPSEARIEKKVSPASRGTPRKPSVDLGLQH